MLATNSLPLISNNPPVCSPPVIHPLECMRTAMKGMLKHVHEFMDEEEEGGGEDDGDVMMEE